MDDRSVHRDHAAGDDPFLPGTRRSRAGGVTEAALDAAPRVRPAPFITLPERGSLPRPGADFGAAAARLAGLTGVVFGWSPKRFWQATPAEVAALVAAVAPADAAPADAALVARLQEAYPDG